MVIKLNMMTDAGNYVSTAYSAVLILVVVAVVVVAGETARSLFSIYPVAALLTPRDLHICSTMRGCKAICVNPFSGVLIGMRFPCSAAPSPEPDLCLIIKITISTIDPKVVSIRAAETLGIFRANS
jgi:hypothetical protein